MFTRRFTSKNERGENALLLVQGHSERPETWEITSNPEYVTAPGVRIGAVEITGTAIDRFAELESAADGWISVNDRLPEADKTVLLRFPNNIACGFYQDMRHGPWGVWSGDDFFTEISWDEVQPTHWMELPAPPADAE